MCDVCASSAPLCSIVNHQLGDKGAFAVASFIETARTLIIVDIQRNGATPEGITRIAEAVSVNKTIQSLEYVPNAHAKYRASQCSLCTLGFRCDHVSAYTWSWSLGASLLPNPP